MILAEVPTRPALRYFGGKWNLAAWIISHFPPHRVYVEPFGGAGSVLLQKPRAYAEIYNDLCDEVVSLFKVLRDPRQAKELEAQLILTPYSRSEFEGSYEPSADAVESARRLVARSFMGFGANGVSGQCTGFRSNSNRSGTTPAHDWTNYPEGIAALTARLRGIVIENRNAIEVIAAHDSEETLIYADPPYPLSTRGNIKRYAVEMEDEDHERLAAALKEVKGMVLLSGYGCPLYESLYKGWQVEKRASLADGARAREEVLWLNEAAVNRRERRLL